VQEKKVEGKFPDVGISIFQHVSYGLWFLVKNWYYSIYFSNYLALSIKITKSFNFGEVRFIEKKLHQAKYITRFTLREYSQNPFGFIF